MNVKNEIMFITYILLRKYFPFQVYLWFLLFFFTLFFTMQPHSTNLCRKLLYIILQNNNFLYLQNYYMVLQNYYHNYY